MSNLFKKVAAGISSVAVAASMLVPSATLAAPMAGETYKTTDGTVWFISKDMKKHPFTSWGAYQSYAFLSGQALKDADASVTALPTGDFVKPRDGSIFCANETKGSDVKGECAFISGGKKAAFTSEAVFSGLGFSFSRAMYGDSSFLEKTSNIDNASAAHPAGTLINDNGTYKLVVAGGTWGIPSPEVLTSWGYSFSDAVMANSADKALSQTGVIPARVAGELVPSATAGGVSPVTSSGCPSDNSEGSVDDTTMGSADETEALEGQEEVEIYSVEVELNDDGDLCLDRVDVWFSQTETASDEPWDYFTEISLLVDGEVVATVDADSESDWSEEANGEISVVGTDNEYRLRFAGLSSVLASDETTDISVAVSMVDNLDSADEDAKWYVEFDDDAGFRFTDGTGFIFTEGLSSATDLEDFFTVGESEEAVIEVSLSDDSPDASVVEVKDTTADTNDVTIATYTIEETEGVNVNISEIKVDVAIVDPVGGVDPSGAGTVVKKAYLVIDDEVVGTESVSSATDNVVVTFDGLDIDLEGDSELDIEVRVDLYGTNAGARYDEGTTVNADDLDVTEFEDDNGNDESDIAVTEGPAGDAHQLRSEGMQVTFVSESSSRSRVQGKADEGTYTLKMDVKAFGSDVYLSDSFTAGNNVVDTDEKEVTALATISSTLDATGSGVEKVAGGYKISKDRTATVTIVSTVTPGGTGGNDSGNFKVYVDSLAYGLTLAGISGLDYNFNMGVNGDFVTGWLYLAE